MMTFSAYASKNIRIDQDNNGLFALVPDQSGTWMTVRCVESKTSVYASHCSCHTFSKKQHCNHVELVQAYWNKIYAPKVEAPVVVEAPKVAKTRKPRTGLVRKVRNGGLVRVEQKVTPVAETETVVETPAQEIAISLNIPVAEVEAIALIAADYRQEIKPKHTDLCLPIGPRDTKKDMMKAALTTNRGFQLLR